MKLDKQQKLAVESPLSNISVMAGAGSGKTRVLTERVKYITENYGISPSNILAFTYTRKACNEMKERLVELMGIQAKKLTVVTIHGFCMRMLYRYGNMIGWNVDTMTVFSEPESREMLNITLDDMGLRKNKKMVKGVKKRDINNAFSHLAATGNFPDQETDEKMYDVILEFYNNCRKVNTLTYGFILTEFSRLMKVEEVRDIIRNEYQHVLLDEMQDTTVLQWSLVNLLDPKSLFCTGDERQSIFGFAGSDIEHTRLMTESFDQFTIKNNYRSCEVIVDKANDALPQYPGMIYASGNGTGDYNIIESKSDTTYKLVLKALSFGFNPGEIAILCRINRPLEKVTEDLRERGMSVHFPKEREDRFISHETRTANCIMSLMVNEDDEFSFRYISEFLGLSKLDMQKIKSFATTEMISILDAYHTKFYNDEEIGKNLLRINDHVRSWINEKVESFTGETKEEKITKYLKWFAMRDLHAHQEDVPDDHIQCLSIHMSKGLEFPCVILIGASEGMLPSRMAKTPEQIGEERRLYYVALTRAKKCLMVSPRPEEECSRFVS